MSTDVAASNKKMYKGYKGGCHCGFIRYTVDLDLTPLKADKCNCSICLKSNLLSLEIQPEQFKLVSPASLNDVGDYVFASKCMHHYFCRDCGIHCVGKQTHDSQGKELLHMIINLVTLDQDQEVDLRKFKVEYWDGKGRNWSAGGKEEPWEGGCY
jgi:hypothetical protein